MYKRFLGLDSMQTVSGEVQRTAVVWLQRMKSDNQLPRPGGTLRALDLCVEQWSSGLLMHQLSRLFFKKEPVFVAHKGYYTTTWHGVRASGS